MEVDLTASMYMLVMFLLKIMLKIVQKTDVSYNFVNEVFMDEDINYGEKLMLSVLDIATQQVSLGYHKITSELPDILSEPIEMKCAEENKFFEPKNIERIGTRNMPNKAAIINEIQFEIKEYISKLRIGIRARLDIADTKELNCVSFSEAPAEGVFSVWERITSHKPSLSLETANALLRVSREGPKAGTNKALNISEKALNLWPSGERFTTVNWIPGMVSKSVKTILES